MNDDYRLVNPVLRQVMKHIFQNRMSYPIKYYCDTRLEKVDNKFFAQMFFMSKGCSHDLNGGCTMCNYGYGKAYENLDLVAILEDVRQKSANLPAKLHEIVVGPTGSLLDEEEVPGYFLDQLLAILSKIECDEFTCETRADTVTEEKLLLLKHRIHSRKITLELGVESIDLWCLRNCINKNTSIETIKQAVQIAHNNDIQVCANIAVGFPFVNDAFCINSAVKSIRNMLELDVSCVALFAYNIRPGTLLEWLWKEGMYDCTSLWSMVEVLSHFTDEELHRIQISWYRNYYADKSKIIQMPYLCSDCESEVLALFDAYRNMPCKQTLQPLLDYDCSCKRKWYAHYRMQSPHVTFPVVKDCYMKMGRAFSIPEDVLNTELKYMQDTLLNGKE